MGPNLVEDVVIGGLRFGHAIDSHLNVFFEGHGLTPLQFNALRILYVRDPENVGLPTGAIAARLLSRVPDVPRLIDRLAERGLIERARSTDDRRVVFVRLTTAGKALVEELHAPLLASNRTLFPHMSESELATLAQGLARALAGPLSRGRPDDVETKKSK
jgi:DNA-binding MarR family transcriptional regulator